MPGGPGGGPKPVVTPLQELLARERGDEIGFKKLFAHWSLIATSILLFVGTAVFVTYCWQRHWDVSDRLVIAWLTYSTAQAVAVMMTVARYLFPSTGRPQSCAACGSPPAVAE